MANRAADIMTRNVTVVREEESIREAAMRLAKDDIGALPICDEQKHIKGILTDRDIVVQVIAHGRDVNTTRARDLEKGEIITVRPDDSVEHVHDLMAQHQIRRIPVVEDGSVVGMISQADVARTLDPARTGSMVSEISKS